MPSKQIFTTTRISGCGQKQCCIQPWVYMRILVLNSVRSLTLHLRDFSPGRSWVRNGKNFGEIYFSATERKIGIARAGTALPDGTPWWKNILVNGAEGLRVGCRPICGFHMTAGYNCRHCGEVWKTSGSMLRLLQRTERSNTLRENNSPMWTDHCDLSMERNAIQGISHFRVYTK